MTGPISVQICTSGLLGMGTKWSTLGFRRPKV